MSSLTRVFELMSIWGVPLELELTDWMSELWEQERIDWGVMAKSLDSRYSTRQFLEMKTMSLIWILVFQSYPARE